MKDSIVSVLPAGADIVERLRLAHRELLVDFFPGFDMTSACTRYLVARGIHGRYAGATLAGMIQRPYAELPRLVDTVEQLCVPQTGDGLFPNVVGYADHSGERSRRAAYCVLNIHSGNRYYDYKTLRYLGGVIV